ncbi:MAG: 3-oxoacyl-ACP reductase FabG [Candidatus Omnitrophica bacterium]|nr:3-oxoacyl-ACP reductase FabG [Candidatus Omnitrophota bacterium]
MNVQLKNQRALVTGGNSGIGEAVVLALAEAGANVAINYVTHPETAKALVGQIQQHQGDALALEADVSNPEAVARMFAELDKSWGGLDILVNNAGIDGPRAPAWEVDLAGWRKVLEVNLFGTLHCAREALKRMVAQKRGVVLNMSSVHEVIAWSGYSAYTTSKAGLAMLTKTLAQEAAPFGVRVLALAPGAIQTPINQSVWSDPKNYEDLLDKIPLKRMGQPDEIAQMAVVLVSDVASYVTARTIFVDGGMTDYPGFAHGG